MDAFPIHQYTRYIADRTAILSFGSTPLVILLAARNSPISWLTGASFARLQIWHRWVSRVTFGAVFIHAAAYIILILAPPSRGFWAMFEKPYLQAGWVVSAPGLGSKLENLLKLLQAFIGGNVLCIASWRRLREISYEVFLVGRESRQCWQLLDLIDFFSSQTSSVLLHGSSALITTSDYSTVNGHISFGFTSLSAGGRPSESCASSPSSSTILHFATSMFSLSHPTPNAFLPPSPSRKLHSSPKRPRLGSQKPKERLSAMANSYVYAFDQRGNGQLLAGDQGPTFSSRSRAPQGCGKAIPFPSPGLSMSLSPISPPPRLAPPWYRRVVARCGSKMSK